MSEVVITVLGTMYEKEHFKSTVFNDIRSQ